MKPRKLGESILLRYPFHGDYKVTLVFGALPDDPNLRSTYKKLGIVGHTGLDFNVPTGTIILASSPGVVIQSGYNGDFGISVTIRHEWGTSIYGHLNESFVDVDTKATRGMKIGLSDATGTATGPHLHFGIMPNHPNLNNGYKGYIDPMPYFKK